MKDRKLAILSLALSLAFLCYAFWVHLHSRQAALKALRQREIELVQNWRPKFESLYSGMGVDPKLVVNNPTTLEALFDPIIAVMNGLGGMTDSETNSARNREP